jgi:hypothetical protein
MSNAADVGNASDAADVGNADDAADGGDAGNVGDEADEGVTEGTETAESETEETTAETLILAG